MAAKTRRPEVPHLEIPPELLNQFNELLRRSSKIPPHCPWAVGDPVKRHGYTGYQGHPSDFPATGFTGWVVGYFGATCLRGITTDGRVWVEEWGALHPLDEPLDPWAGCICCLEQRRQWHTNRALATAQRPVQLALFDLEMSP